MRVSVDRGRCEGHGQCEAVAPRVFRLDDDAVSTVIVDGDVPEALRHEAALGVDVCPALALILEQGPV